MRHFRIWGGAPGIEFINSDNTQMVTMAFDDFDSYQYPAGLTLSGNQGNEYFKAPKFIKTGASANDILLGDGSTLSKGALALQRADDVFMKQFNPGVLV